MLLNTCECAHKLIRWKLEVDRNASVNENVIYKMFNVSSIANMGEFVCAMNSFDEASINVRVQCKLGMATQSCFAERGAGGGPPSP